MLIVYTCKISQIKSSHNQILGCPFHTPAGQRIIVRLGNKTLQVMIKSLNWELPRIALLSNSLRNCSLMWSSERSGQIWSQLAMQLWERCKWWTIQWKKWNSQQLYSRRNQPWTPSFWLQKDKEHLAFDISIEPLNKQESARCDLGCNWEEKLWASSCWTDI